MKWSRYKLGLASAGVLALLLLVAPVVLNRIAQPVAERETGARVNADSLSDNARQAELVAELQWLTTTTARPPKQLSDEAIEAELRPAMLELVEKFPDDYQAYHLAGIVAVRFKQTNLAQPLLRRSLELASNDIQIRMDLADMLLQAGNNDGALELLEAGAADGSNSPNYLHMLADAQLRGGDVKQASQTLVEAIQRFPQSEQNLLSLGKAQLQLGDFAAAELSLRTAISINANNRPALIALSQALAFQTKTEEVSQIREELKLMGDGTPEIDSFDSVFEASLRRFACSSFRSLAVVYQRHLDGVTAKHWLDRAHRTDPADSLTLAYLTSYYRNTGEFEAAAEVTRELVQLEPETLHNYESSFKRFPARQTGSGTLAQWGQRGVYSGWHSLLPFLEQTPLFTQVEAFQNVPWGGNAVQIAFLSSRLSFLECPSDAGEIDPAQPARTRSLSSYAFCSGDDYASSQTFPGERLDVAAALQRRPIDNRGIFGRWNYPRIGQITDGTSNTIALSERQRPSDVIGKGMATAIAGTPATLVPLVCRATFNGRQYLDPAAIPRNDTSVGYRAFGGNVFFAAMTTILPPNSASCFIAEGGVSYHLTNGIWSAGSEHTGGVQVALADGSVRFISESIDTGNLSIVAPPTMGGGGMSPYGVWGALGTKSGGEVASVPD